MRLQDKVRDACLGGLILALIFWAPTLTHGAQTGGAHTTKNVLILSEVGTSNPAPANIVRELVSALSAEHEFQVNLYVESLETPAFQDEVSEFKAEQQLSAKYQDRAIDLVVALGPTPIVFMSHFAASFLPGVPVVVCGSSQEQTGYVKLGPRFTGSWLQVAPEKTVDAALNLLPNTREVVIVGGSSVFDRINESVVRASLRAYPRNVEFQYWTDLTMPVLLERLRHLSSGAVVVYVSLFEDTGGNRFLNALTSLPLVTDASAVPVFGLSDGYLGRGVVGGYVLDNTEQGKITAENALEILHGKSANTIPVRFVPGTYMFDARQMHRWGLPERKLPIESTVLYEDGSLWQHIKWTVMVCVLLLLSLGSLIAYLLYNRRQLKRARNEQARLSGMLMNAHEEERKRLASELHDDFSQRLVVLALQLDAECQKASGPSRQQLNSLLDYVSELGSDLHTLSHRLHSSTLERLGLVAGLSAFCEEFTAQHHIPVDFFHENVPESVAPAVALCLFRITQEALRNIRKHSRAAHAKVVLDSVDNCLHLSISDDGIGFDPDDPATRQGLGRMSMAERARLIGARFEISSLPDNGTRVDVWTTLATGEFIYPDSSQPADIGERVAG